MLSLIVFAQETDFKDRMTFEKYSMQVIGKIMLHLICPCGIHFAWISFGMVTFGFKIESGGGG